MKRLAFLLLFASCANATAFLDPPPVPSRAFFFSQTYNGTSGTSNGTFAALESLQGLTGGWAISFDLAMGAGVLSGTPEDYLFTIRNGTNQISGIWGYVAGNLEFFCYNGTNNCTTGGGIDPRCTTGCTATSRIPISDSNTHHVMYLKEAGTTSNFYRCLDGTCTLIGNILFTLPASLTEIYIGASEGGNNAAATISNFAVFNRALNADERVSVSSGRVNPNCYGPIWYRSLIRNVEGMAFAGNTVAPQPSAINCGVVPKGGPIAEGTEDGGGGVGTLLFSDSNENPGTPQTGSYADVVCGGDETTIVKNGSHAIRANGSYIGGGCSFGKVVPGINFSTGITDAWMAGWVYLKNPDGAGDSHIWRIASGDASSSTDWELVLSVFNNDLKICNYHYFSGNCDEGQQTASGWNVSTNGNAWHCWVWHVDLGAAFKWEFYIDGTKLVENALFAGQAAFKTNYAHSVDNINQDHVIDDMIVDDIRIYSGGSIPSCA